MPMLAARIVDSRTGVDELAPAWERLRRSLEGSPFTGPALYRAWLDERGQRVRPFVVAVEDELGELRAVAPLVRRGPLVWSLPGRVKVAGELLAAEDEARVAWREVAAAAVGARGVALLLVPHATDDERGAPGLLAAAAELGLRAEASARFRRYRLQLHGTADDYLQSWSRNQRSHLRKARNKLERVGTLSFRLVPATEGYAELRAIHMRQWSPEQTISWLHTEDGARIDQRLIAEVPASILFLELDGRPIAATLWLDSGRVRVALYLTRDVDVASGSPGELLHVELVRRAYADGMRELDLMGEGGHKHRWALEPHDGFDVAVAAPGVLGAAALGARHAQRRAAAAVNARRSRN